MDFQPPSIESLRQSDWRRLPEDELRYLQDKARFLRENTDKSILMTNWGPASLGPPSVGSITEWLVMMVTEPDYVSELMDLAAEIAIDNLKLYWEAIGIDIDIISLDGHDFGSQERELFSPAVFEQFHEPCYKKQCDWIHENTPWKISKHCCGSIPNLIEPMIRAGIDVLNPVQTSAKNMEADVLKSRFGDRITFRSGGVDTQRILPFGTPDDVREDVRQRLQTLGTDGGFIWAAIHNIQYDIPPENIVAVIDAVHEYGHYPLEKETLPV